jgi:hypothetical protein
MIGARVVAAAALALGAALGVVSATTPASPGVRLYHDNPEHVWNRVHAALFVRVAPDGRKYGGDRVDPLLWTNSKYLLQGPSHDRAVTVLTEFVDTHGEKLIDDPLKRAILQRDLWSVFDWLEDVHNYFEKPSLNSEVVRRGARPLHELLAAAIARLALAPEQIAALPDNLAGAAGAGGLPPDLFGGPWVSVGRPDGPMALQHLNDSGPGKNSVFLVQIRLSDGRDATLRYLERLRAFKGPLWLDDPARGQSFTPYPNPDIPQFPAGTQVALVRRALLIDSTGKVSPSRLTEQVQHRVYRSIEKMTPQAFGDAHRIEESMFPRAGQDFEEFSLSRAALFASGTGGLLPLGAAGPFFLTFSSKGIDAFEMRSGDRPRTFGVEPAQARRLCKDCHGAPGVYSVNSFVPFRLMNGPDAAGAPRLFEISLADAARTAVAWKQQRPEWIALKRLLMR